MVDVVSKGHDLGGGWWMWPARDMIWGVGGGCVCGQQGTDQEYVFDPMFRLPVSLQCVHTNSTILCHIGMEDLCEEKAWKPPQQVV